MHLNQIGAWAAAEEAQI